MKISNLNKSYGDSVVYNNFNLDIEDGKITCILGESGSGKTTLLNILAGLTDYQGDITKVTCSYIFQQPRLVPNLTVKGNLKLVCNDDKKIDEALAMAQIADKASSYPISLSGGQAQRVSILRAFLFKNDVILMDEPFASLDLKLKIKLMDFFKSMWKSDKKTAVFVTHDIDEALYFADRIIAIDHGKIIFDEVNEGQGSFGGDSQIRQRILQAILA
jgi:ABC-type nitrate/sulfonate/bicarbonate transport system ATPase subunit